MWRRDLLQTGFCVVAMAYAASLIGCSQSHESAKRDTMTAQVGQYPPGPSGVERPRVGVPPFSVQTAGGIFNNNGDLNTLAADQMTTLLDQSDRFRVIERAQLQKLIDEQNLEGVVKSGELAKQAQVRGVDYLVLGKVTNLRVKRETKSNGFGLGQVGGLVNVGGAAVNQNDVNITTECGVDIRFVDPTTGQIMVSNFSEFNRTDSANSMGVTILGTSAQSSADIQLTEDDKGKILRLALDDAYRKSLPKIDKFLRNQPAKTSDAAPQNNAPPVNSGNSNSSPATGSGNTAVAGKKFCPNCGTANPLDAKFCSKCGAKLE